MLEEKKKVTKGVVSDHGLEITDKVLQRFGQDEVLREYSFGGVHTDRDIRFYMTRQELEMLLAVSKNSSTSRVVIQKAGLKLRVCRDSTGHLYETLHLSGLAPCPENNSGISVEAPVQDARDIAARYTHRPKGW